MEIPCSKTDEDENDAVVQVEKSESETKLEGESDDDNNDDDNADNDDQNDDDDNNGEEMEDDGDLEATISDRHEENVNGMVVEVEQARFVPDFHMQEDVEMLIVRAEVDKPKEHEEDVEEIKEPKEFTFRAKIEHLDMRIEDLLKEREDKNRIHILDSYDFDDSNSDSSSSNFDNNDGDDQGDDHDDSENDESVDDDGSNNRSKGLDEDYDKFAIEKMIREAKNVKNLRLNCSILMNTISRVKP
ncbi:hypothetical protein QVD17_41750 [Tagetes erecta]|uniref:Uncharacterized protein n=1 Tax=Tagetes erecta TaxID=13708 RepID=A0AAD8JPV0_TARER|nr:hypothetical protein QVD17_41750 [Tagetes erecta]